MTLGWDVMCLSCFRDYPANGKCDCGGMELDIKDTADAVFQDNPFMRVVKAKVLLTPFTPPSPPDKT